MSLHVSQPPGCKKDLQIGADKDFSLKAGVVVSSSLSLGSLEAILLREGIVIHKKFLTNPISPSCTNINSAPGMQHMEIETQSARQHKSGHMTQFCWFFLKWLCWFSDFHSPHQIWLCHQIVLRAEEFSLGDQKKRDQ